MMPRYVIAARRAGYDEDGDYINDHLPTVSDHEPIDTGLLDADGNAIQRLPNPMGFIWSE